VPWLVNVADMKRPGEPPTQFAASTGRLATVMITGAAPSPPVSRRRRDADEGADWAVGSESWGDSIARPKSKRRSLEETL